MLAIAATILLAVIVFQNLDYPQLRNLTISDGLYPTVPTFWALDAAYLLLAVALCYTFQHPLAYSASLALIVTAISNSASVWVDKVTKGKHNEIHTWATIVMFVLVLALEFYKDTGWRWYLTIAGIVLPGVVAAALDEAKSKILPGPAAEKTAVLLLCAWLMTW